MADGWLTGFATASRIVWVGLDTGKPWFPTKQNNIYIYIHTFVMYAYYVESCVNARENNQTYVYNITV